jgi:hypothetical protein
MRKVIIAGGRDFDDYDYLECTLVDLFCPTSNYPNIEVVSGTARGADTLGERFASDSATPVRQFKPDWETHGRVAGFIRNQDMAEYADVLVAFWNGESRGTRDMIDRALREGLEVHVYRYASS